MKKAGIAVAVVVALGLAGTAGAWYTGTQMEDVLRDAVAHSNEQIDEAFPDGSVTLELADFERGVFSSTARYDFVYPGGEDQGPVTVTIIDRLVHGPFPLSRLKQLKLVPVMATSEAVLERSDYLAPLFAASGEQPPVVITSTLGYGSSINGNFAVAPLVFDDEEMKAEFSPVTLEFATDVAGDAVLLDGRSDGMRLTAQTEAGQPFTLEMSNITLFADRHRGTSDFYLGEGRMAVETLRLEGEPGSTLVFEGLAQTDTLTEDAGNLAGTLKFDLAKATYQDHELGSAGMNWSFSRLDQVAAREINELYNQQALSVYQGEEPPEQSERWRDAIATMLAAQPQLALDLLVIRTPNGESRARAEVMLASPESFDVPAAQLVPQLLSRVDAHVQLSRPMLRDVIMYKALFEPGADPEAVALEAEVMVQMLAGMAETTRLARQEGDNLVTSLVYSDGSIMLNGKAIPAEAMQGMLALFSPASQEAAAE
ncbi:YdgA family protein [Halopseudomonas sp.]|uniref:YdgA family protein n=1 Tax=Halopseudomonas sp. TaxID=2901191 RepID=UPI0035695375